MASESKTFTGITRAKIASLRERAGAFVRLPDGDNGEISGQGVSGRFDYDEAAQTLTITIDEVPMFVPRAMVWATVENALKD